MTRCACAALLALVHGQRRAHTHVMTGVGVHAWDRGTDWAHPGRAGAVASNTYLAAQTPGGIQLDRGTLVLSGLEAAKTGGAVLQARFRLGVPPGADKLYRLGCMCGPLPPPGTRVTSAHRAA